MSGVSIALLFLVFSGPTAAGAALLGWAALSQAAIASDRHQEQTNADRQRRITDGFSKAIEQLASDKLEVRLGGIYSLERISKESPDDYWTVMENSTAFVRERSRRVEAERTQDFEERVSKRAYFIWLEAGQPEGLAEYHRAQAAKQEKIGEPPPTDITAVLTVINRRSEGNRERERAKGWRLDFSGAVLRRAVLRSAHLEEAVLLDAHLQGADLTDAHLQGADFIRAHLEEANLGHAHLEEANLRRAHVEGASLMGAHLEGAFLRSAHLEGAVLMRAHLEGADLSGAHLEGANLGGTHLRGARLERAEGLTAAQLAEAYGGASTTLPEGLPRSAHWPQD